MRAWKSLDLILITLIIISLLLPANMALAQETPTPAPGAAAPLAVTSTVPSDGVLDLPIDAALTVSFNRPVVPLTGVADQADLPQPLTFDPPVEGAGQWLSTSIYTFAPTLGWAGGTTYSVVVEPLTAVGGAAMDAPYTFSFSTAQPAVVEVRPQGEQVAPDSSVNVSFSQPMDPASTEAAFALVHEESDEEVEGSFAWDAAGTTLTFTPTAPPAFGASYLITVDESAQPVSLQGGLAKGVESRFSVVPLPAVRVATPPDGSTGVLPDRQVRIQFASAMSSTTVLEAISISPPITATSVYSYFNDWENMLVIGWERRPNTDYTITVGGAARDLYGNTLGDDFTLRFTTGDFAPFVRVDLEQFTHFSAGVNSFVSLFYRNMESVDAALYAVPVEEFVADFNGDSAWEIFQTYQGTEANLIWRRSYPAADEAINESYERILILNDGEDEMTGAPLAPGLYALVVELPTLPADPDTGMVPPARSVHLIAVSRHNLVVKKSNTGDSLAWLTELQTGDPVAGLEVDFHAPGMMRSTANMSLAQATTDDDGLALLDVGFPVESPWWPLVATVGEWGNDDFAVASSGWNQGINSYDFNINGGYSLEPYLSVFYTDRPLYRPGQTVHWKGIVRRFADDTLSLPDPTQMISITVRNDRGEAIQQAVLPFDELGTVSGSVELAGDAPTGFYSLEAIFPTGPQSAFWGGVGFQVAAYEKPEYAVSLTTDQEEYAQSETIVAVVQADYFSGGALANAPVTWQVVAEPYSFVWEQAPEGRWFSFEPFDPENESYDPYRGLFGFGLVKQGEGRTDAGGAFTVTLPATLGDALGSQQWSIQATVQSPTNQFVVASTRVPIHRGDLYVGVGSQQVVGEVGSPTTIDLVSVTPEGEAVGGVDVDVTIYEVRWSSVQEKSATGGFTWQSSFERVAAFSESGRSGRDGFGEVEWTPARAGQYQAVAAATDSAGNQVQSAAWLYVANRDPNDVTAWRRENNDRITLVADKREYSPGDTARILVPNPFAGATRALLTIERSGVDSAELITVEGSSGTIEVPITDEMIPTAFVSVVLIKGIDESNPTPALRVGMAQLNVEVSARALAIEVETESASGAEIPQPGEVVTYTLTVQDATGAPVEGAAVSVALVDKALLSLATAQTPTLLDAFYGYRPLGVTTGATLIVNRDRVSQQLGEGAKGGGGGGDGGMIIDARDEFPDTALWQATLRSDEDGRIVFALSLPDSLTTWTLTARAVTADTKVGEATHELVVSKELQVRPILPRFATAGDRIRIGAVVLNTTDVAAPDASLSFTLEGATAQAVAELEQSLDLAANGSATASLPIVVDGGAIGATDAITITIAAEAGSLSDAVRIVLPVLRYTLPETVATAGEVPADEGGVTEQILVPEEATEEGALRVRLEPSLAAGLMPALEFLESFPWECTEQTVSRFLPNVAALQALGVAQIDPAAADLYLVGASAQSLVNRQNADGGWGTWPGEVSNTFVSAYALWGLATLRGLGYPVPDATVERAISFLERQYSAPDLTTNDWELNQAAFIHFVLAGLGEGDPGRMSTLYDARPRLQAYGKAWLALALSAIDPADARIASLLDELAGTATQSATGAWWQEPTTDFATLNTDLRSTAVVLYAFAHLRPDAPLLPGAVRWLMTEREQGGVWSNTQENAWSIFALTAWMEATGELQGDFDWLATLNGDAIASGEVRGIDPAGGIEGLAASELRVAVADLLRDAANTLTLERTEGPGALYYTAALDYRLDAPAIGAQERGIVVERTFSDADGPISSAAAGDLFTMTVTVVAPTSLTQLAVDVPIPAGTEIAPATTPGITFDQFGNPTDLFVRDPWQPTWRDFRDERVALFDSHTPAGTHQYSVQLRATVPGEYRVLPAHAQMLYFTEVWGRSAGSLFSVTE